MDTAALSIPFEIACPEDVVFGCGDPLVYPDVYVLSGGCGDPSSFTVTYDPAEEALPIGVPTSVTATVTDADRPTRRPAPSWPPANRSSSTGSFRRSTASGGSCGQSGLFGPAGMRHPRQVPDDLQWLDLFLGPTANLPGCRNAPRARPSARGRSNWWRTNGTGIGILSWIGQGQLYPDRDVAGRHREIRIDQTEIAGARVESCLRNLGWLGNECSCG